METENCGYLIIESSTEPTRPNIIEHNKDNVVIEAIMQEAEAGNRNRREYAFDALDGAVRSPQIQEKLKRKSLFGEAGHPLSDKMERQTYIDQTRMSHVIKNLWWEQNILKGQVASANTTCGKDFEGLIRQGTEVAFSMRGLGGVTRKVNGLTRVEKPLHIITWDWVIFPSHSNAYQTSIIKESLDAIGNSKIITEGLMLPVEMDDILSYIKEESDNIKTSINHLELDPRTAKLGEDNKTISFDIEDGKAVLFVEDAIRREINSYLAKF
jgi:Prohead core protein serine protease